MVGERAMGSPSAGAGAGSGHRQEGRARLAPAKGSVLTPITGMCGFSGGSPEPRNWGLRGMEAEAQGMCPRSRLRT